MPTLHDPIAFSFLGISIRWYAIFILSGIIVALLVMQPIARRRGMDPNFLLDAAPWVVLAAIIGARFYYILLKFDFYMHHPEEAINVRLGGLTIHGALAAGIGVFAWLCWRNGYRFLAWADVVIAAVPIGQAIGRWGNWANQEAFGTPTTLPWAVTISPEHRPPQYAAYSTFHPTFLYEGILDLLIAAFLIWMVLRMPRSRFWREGDALWSYLILYGVARFIIERDRTDSLFIGPLPAAYWLSLAFIAIGGGMLILRRTIWPGRRADPVPLEMSDPAPIPAEPALSMKQEE
jgi:phosphatidylglycerol:prolipoprotein diacylglycerol transferase